MGNKTCEALRTIADLSSNPFGETRSLPLEAGKKHTLGKCKTNANIGILAAVKFGVTVSVAGAQSTVLKVGEPFVVDFCREVSVVSTSATSLFFAQAWHPEFAGVERTTEIRARASGLDLTADEVTVMTDTVNKFSKTGWEAASMRWRQESALQTSLTAALKAFRKTKSDESADDDLVVLKRKD